MRESQCEAVILAVLDYGEADKIITFLTREHGKIKGIARNAKKSRKRFGGALEIFARLRLQLVLRDGLSRLQGADVVTIFTHIREDFSKIGYAGYACELIDRFLPEAQANTRLYRLLVSYLEHLDSAPCCADDRRFFEVNLLNIAGYRPTLENCAQCGIELSTATDLRYSPRHNGISCSNCVRTGREISPITVSLLKTSLQTGRFGVVRFPGATLGEAGDLLDSIIASHLNRPLHSLSFLREALRIEGC
jgi:DNA repair protein RecO (recombination protein O)